jgi:SnoaL-like polyketide cyclase
MSVDDIGMLPRRWVEAVNDGNLTALGALLHPEFVQHTPPGLPPGPASATWAIRMFRGGFPDLRIDVDWLMVDGDRVAYHATTRGTHHGTFLGHAATGRSFVASSLDALRVHEDGRVLERWTAFDTFGMLQQLGLVPSPVRSGDQ